MIEHALEIFVGAALIYFVLWHRRKPAEDTGCGVRIKVRESLTVLRGRDLL